MSIQSTCDITRNDAIERIELIHNWFNREYPEYRNIVNESFETDDPSYYTEEYKSIDIRGIEGWTNRMLEDLLDRPYFRLSKFDNYCIVDKYDHF